MERGKDQIESPASSPIVGIVRIGAILKYSK